MKTLDFRTLRANEIEVRPSHIKDGKVNLLLYINSRAVVSLLNETVGNLNWQSKFYEVNGQLIGEIGIYDNEKGAWIWKGDTGSESNIEASKGLISDVYKRALSRWGVDELYSSPKIQVPDDGYGNSGYRVLDIQYNEHREICGLVIVNRFGKEVYRMDEQKTTISNQPVAVAQQPSPSASAKELSEKEYKIKTLIDSANRESAKEGTNQFELKKFVDFYTQKIERDGWQGDFRFDVLFASWINRTKPRQQICYK